MLSLHPDTLNIPGHHELRGVPNSEVTRGLPPMLAFYDAERPTLVARKLDEYRTRWDNLMRNGDSIKGDTPFYLASAIATTSSVLSLDEPSALFPLTALSRACNILNDTDPYELWLLNKHLAEEYGLHVTEDELARSSLKQIADRRRYSKPTPANTFSSAWLNVRSYVGDKDTI